MTTPRQPTLLVFTLGADAESRRRPLLGAPADSSERDLRQACFEAVVASGRRAGCRVAVSCPELVPTDRGLRWLPQQGRGFGERLSRAVARLERESENGPLVVVGTDTPELGAAEIERALALLDRPGDGRRRAVLGPAPDGGIYLLATSHPVAHLLVDVPWCRRNTRRRLAETLERAGFEVAELAPLVDLDSPGDLHRLLARSKTRLGTSFARLIDRLLDLLADLVRPPVAPPERVPVPVPVRPSGGRAPPRRPVRRIRRIRRTH